jgi:hypothetical protein
LKTISRAKRIALAQAPLDSREFRRLMDGRLSETRWQKQVERALDAFGWWWMHVPPNVIVCEFTGRRHYRGIRKGVPDIWAIRPPYMLWLELKTETGARRPEQDQVMDKIRACDLLAIAARPRDREQVLALLSHPESSYAALKVEQQRARAPRTRARVRV